ncbi:MAG: glycosyltransferase family 9 protein [Candidatus Cloacimonetes bacterium]|nr:glycosyltransferase family 9 protein [Candidatus Cloacimonadota bacterium]
MIDKQRCLMIETAFLGDIILSSALVQALHNNFPALPLDVITTPVGATILANNPNISRIIVFDKKRHKLRDFFKLLKHIQATDYAIGFSPHRSTTSARLLKMGRVPVRVGFSGRRASKLYTHTTEKKKNRFAYLRYLDLLNSYTNGSSHYTTELFPSEKDTRKAKELLNGKKPIAIAPGSVWNTKRWLAEYYSKLTFLLSEQGFSPVFIGSPDEQELCADIVRQSGLTNVLNLCGTTTILEAAAIIRQSRLLICNDSSPLHIANAVNTPVSAFFGPTVREFGFFPYREGDIVFETDIPCRPCGHHGGKSCPEKNHSCMRSILPEDVLPEILKTLKKPSRH